MKSGDGGNGYTQEPIYSKKTKYMLGKINEHDRRDETIRLKNLQTIENICKLDGKMDLYEELVEKTKGYEFFNGQTDEKWVRASHQF